MPSRACAGAVLIGALHSTAILAQQPASPITDGALLGSRVRVTAEMFGRSKTVGTLVSVTRDSVSVFWLTDTIAFARSAIGELEVLAGSHRNAARGAGFGILGGMGVGAIWGATSYSPCIPKNELLSCVFAFKSRTSQALGGALVGVIPGGLIGLTLGLLTVSDKWKAANIASFARLEVVPQAKGVAASWSYSFP